MDKQAIHKNIRKERTGMLLMRLASFGFTCLVLWMLLKWLNLSTQTMTFLMGLCVGIIVTGVMVLIGSFVTKHIAG